MLLAIVNTYRCCHRFIRSGAVLVAFFLSALLAPAMAADPDANGGAQWSRFRGPNGSGISEAKTVPVEFTVTDYNWRTELSGGGHSSPVVWGKHIYLTVAGTAAEDGRAIVCFHADDGRELWRAPGSFNEHNLNKLNNFASSTPTCNETGVFVSWASGQESLVVGISHDGKPLWERSWGQFTSDHGSATSPILVDELLILQTDSKDEGRSQIRALDAATGADVWQHERVTADGEKHLTVYSTPTVMEIGGRKVVAFLSPNDGWLGLDGASGDVVWRHRDAYTYRSVGSLVSSDGILFATMGSGNAGKDSAALKFESGKKEPRLAYSMSLKENSSKGLSYVPTPIIFEGLLFLWSDGGILTCRDAQTGEEVFGGQRIGGDFFSSPICVDGKIYCGSRNGDMVVIPASRDFKILARNQFDAGIYATPAIVDGRLIVRTETHLISIGGKK